MEEGSSIHAESMTFKTGSVIVGSGQYVCEDVLADVVYVYSGTHDAMLMASDASDADTKSVDINDTICLVGDVYTATLNKGVVTDKVVPAIGRVEFIANEPNTDFHASNSSCTFDIASASSYDSVFIQGFDSIVIDNLKYIVNNPAKVSGAVLQLVEFGEIRNISDSYQAAILSEITLVGSGQLSIDEYGVWLTV
jgi:hypothetical protein